MISGSSGHMLVTNCVLTAVSSRSLGKIKETDSLNPDSHYFMNCITEVEQL